MKSIKSIFISSCFVGITIGLIMVGVTWEHNPNCSIHCNDYINWTALLTYLSLSAIISGTAFAILLRR